MLASKTFLFVDQSSPDFLHGTQEESLLIKFLSDFGYMEPSGDICDQSRKLSKIALNFGCFFALPNLRGGGFLKLYIYYDPCLAARRMENVL